ncbi:MAG: CAP domain-containing protein [Planctomycetota bacterium]
MYLGSLHGKNRAQGSPRLALLLLTSGLLLPGGCARPVQRPPEIDRAYGYAAAGRFAEAERILAALEKRQDLDQAGIAWMVANIRQDMERFVEAYKGADVYLEQLVKTHERGEALSLARAEAMRRDAEDRYYAKAIRQRLSNFDELRRGIREAAPASAEPASPGESPQKSPESVPESAEPEASGPAAASKSARDAPDVAQGSEEELFGATIPHYLEDLEALAEAGDFVNAIRGLRSRMPTGSAADAVRELLWKVQSMARQRIAEVRSKAEGLEREGKVTEALALLDKAAASFPRSGPLSALRHLRREVDSRARIDVVLARRPTAPAIRVDDGIRVSQERTPVDESGIAILRRRYLTQADEALGRRSFAEAAEKFRKAADICKGWWPRLEDAYEQHAKTAEQMEKLLGQLGAAVEQEPDKYADVAVGYGTKAEILAADASGIKARIRGEVEEVPWSSIPDSALAGLIARTALTAEHFFAAALLAIRAAEPERAEGYLKEALARDARAKPRVDAFLSRLREEDPGRGGYVLEHGEFMASRAIRDAAIKLEIEKAMARVFARKTETDRNKGWDSILVDHGKHASILVEGLVAQKKRLFELLRKSPIRSSWKRLRSLRVELDHRREHAKELIFDTVTYFYPYRPPEVPNEKAKLYPKVQAEVDRRVARVREIWNGKSTVLTLPPRLRKAVELYRWATLKLSYLGAETPGLDDEVELIVAKKRNDIRNFALDERERKRFDRAEKIVADNRALIELLVQEKRLLRTEGDLIILTNRYRIMMGYHPLKLDERLVRAAHGHCEEMSRLGYFGHYSPTKGRKTPGDRMRLEGYMRGGGENLARNGSAEGAISAWQHSSGHHRNMLSPTHGDIGTGNVGTYWAQNFGAGKR